MKTCPECGASFADDANFCGECGAKLADLELRALLPAEDKDNENIPNLVTWRLIAFSTEISGMSLDIVCNKSDRTMASLGKFLDAWNSQDQDKLLAAAEDFESDAEINEDMSNLRADVLKVMRLVHDRLWLFEAANIILRRAGKEEFDLKRLRLQGMSLKDLEKFRDNSEISDAIHGDYDALGDYCSDVAEFANEVGDKLDEVV